MDNFAKTGEFFIETNSGAGGMSHMHYHSTYELYYLEAGSRKYFIEDKFFHVSAGDFVLIPPSKLHKTGGAYALRTLVGFTREFLQNTYHAAALDRLLSCFDKLHIVPPKSMQEELKGLLQKIAESPDVTVKTLYLGVLLEKLSCCATDTKYDESLGKIIRYINDNFSSIQNIEEIADNFYISKYHLCRQFKGKMKITLIDYLNTVKVKNSCGFLESTDRNIQEISQLCGFNSTAYFSNVFKKMTGLSPSQYRKEHKKKAKS